MFPLTGTLLVPRIYIPCIYTKCIYFVRLCLITRANALPRACFTCGYINENSLFFDPIDGHELPVLCKSSSVRAIRSALTGGKTLVALHARRADGRWKNHNPHDAHELPVLCKSSSVRAIRSALTGGKTLVALHARR